MCNHLVLGRIGVLGEQGGRLHDLPGLAVTALRNLLGDPRLLQRMVALGAEAFDGGDLLADGVADQSLAGANRLAVDVNRAGAAETRAAPEFRAGHLQLFADDPQQRRVVGRFDGHIPSVDVQGGHVSSEGGVYRLTWPSARPAMSLHLGVDVFIPTNPRLSRLQQFQPWRGSTKRQAQETSFRVLRGSADDPFGPADITK